MFFRTLRAFRWFVAIVVAFHLPAVVRAQETAVVAGGARYIEVADAGESESSPDQGSGDAESNMSGSDDGEADPDDSETDQQSGFDESRRNGADDKFDGPNGALKAVQADRALPLERVHFIMDHIRMPRSSLHIPSV